MPHCGSLQQLPHHWGQLHYFSASPFSLALSTYTIYSKHTGTEHARAKILKGVGVMILTLIAVIFLGGIASMLVNYQVSMRWGEVAGLMSAIGASFGVGYLVRKRMGRLVG